MQFKDIVGQETVKAHLIKTVKDGRISHAQLFLGPEGSGSLALAVAYAQYICCEQPLENDSCGECSSCRKYQKLVHPDLHFSYPFFAKHKEDTALTFVEEWRASFLQNPYLGLDEWRNHLSADNKQANINIAECHSIIQKLSLKPFEAEYKVLIMWLPEYLEKEGNALLKIIEEPAQKTLFLLVAQNQEQILNTIISRTQIVKIPKQSNADVCKFLVEKHQLSEEKAMQLAYLSNGNLQAALTFMTHEENDYHDLLSNWLRACYGNQGLKLVAFVDDDFSKMGRENQKNLLRYGINLTRECMLFLAETPGLIHLSAKELEFISNFSKILNLAKAEAIANELEKAHYHIERNANPKILFLDVSLNLVKILKFNTLPTGTQYIL
ncbi:ATP-binding protein [Pedobacter glucosidilyticus]|uniref:DNA polymerase III subunit n=1 Tax=Pedobacter glucosidilyticus TaxID=1122941 RepID=UPI0003F5B8FD|nr:DNA polymerase III subunit gamma/tau [Pedobacter glucosidilyticus]